MRKYPFLLGMVLLVLSCNKGPIGGFGSSVSNEFSISGTFSGCPMDSMRLYVADGFQFTQVASAAFSGGSEKTFSWSGILSAEGLYYLGQAPNNLCQVMMIRGEKPTVSGNCFDLRSGGKIANSETNARMDMAFRRMNVLQEEAQNCTRTWMTAQQSANPAAMTASRQQMQTVYQKEKSFVDSLIQPFPLVAKLFLPALYQPYDPANNPGNYSSDLDHFLATFSQGLDFSDTSYNYLPSIPDNMGGFAQTAFSQLSDPARSESLIDNLLNKMSSGSLLRRNALRSVVNGLDQVSSTGYIKYAQLYLAENPGNSQVATALRGRIQAYAAQKEAEAKTAIGIQAQEIALATPQGKTLKLSSLRGKVVLIDFWASWCKPCRQENPNVVRMYQRFKSKGFEIYGVSLDRDKKSWVDAIAQDGLTWNHVSDLQFWNCAAAQDYYVRSIPATFLLDKNGVIIAKNLRGPALEAKLEELLGS